MSGEKVALVVRHGNVSVGVWVRESTVMAVEAARVYMREDGMGAWPSLYEECELALFRNGYYEYEAPGNGYVTSFHLCPAYTD